MHIPLRSNIKEKTIMKRGKKDMQHPQGGAHAVVKDNPSDSIAVGHPGPFYEKMIQLVKEKFG